MKYLLIAAASPRCWPSCPRPPSKGVELGVLDCTVEGGTGFIIGSNKDVLCTFKPGQRDFAPESYSGTSANGASTSATTRTVMAWLVLRRATTSTRRARWPAICRCQRRS